jgi:hypothetical protein
MKTFEVQFRYRDRNEETAESMVKVEASSLQARSVKQHGNLSKAWTGSRDSI